MKGNYSDSRHGPIRGRPPKALLAAPADFLRTRAFARAIKAELLPNGDPQRPQAVAVARALQERGANWTLSTGRWAAWWTGKEYPSPMYRALFSQSMPSCAAWLEQQLDDDPLRRHLVALDVLGMWTARHEDWRVAKRRLAYEILVRLCVDWNPEFYPAPKREQQQGPFQLNEYFGKLAAQANTAKAEWGRFGPLVPPNRTVEKWDAAINPLEPTSVVMAMMVHAVSADMAHIGSIKHWVLDIGSGIAAVRALLDLSENPFAYGRIGELSGINLMLGELFWPSALTEISDEYPCRDSHIEALCCELNCEPETIIAFLNQIRRAYFLALSEIGASPLDVQTIINAYHDHRPQVFHG